VISEQLMLRLFMCFTLCLLLLFMGMGLLISHEWGWSEYTTDALYAVYQQQVGESPQFFLVDADGNSEPVSLRWREGNLTAISCSPDGRTLAFLGDAVQLYVINRSGVLYDWVLGSGYDGIYTANSGRVAVFREDGGLPMIVDTQGSDLPVPDDHSAFEPLVITSSGLSLSHKRTGGVYLVSPAGDELMGLPLGTFSPLWLASEQLLMFSDSVYTDSWDGGIVDAASRMILRFHDSIIPYGIFSPDATKQVMPLDNLEKHQDQLYVIDPLTRRSIRQLTYDEGVIHIPLCFLTFKPEILIGN
jgi:hypothetical protein